MLNEAVLFENSNDKGIAGASYMVRTSATKNSLFKTFVCSRQWHCHFTTNLLSSSCRSFVSLTPNTNSLKDPPIHSPWNKTLNSSSQNSPNIPLPASRSLNQALKHPPPKLQILILIPSAHPNPTFSTINPIMPSIPTVFIPRETSWKSPATKRYEERQRADAEKKANREPGLRSSSKSESDNSCQISESERMTREEKRLRDLFGDLIR